MLHKFILTCFLFSFIVHSISVERRDGNVKKTQRTSDNSVEAHLEDSRQVDDQHCWITLNAKNHFETMDALDERYAKCRHSFHNKITADNQEFDKHLLKAMLSSRGRVSGQKGNPNDIPAGLNLGGYCMLKMEKSVLFFHRMKLRNNTRFRINYLHTNLKDLEIRTQLSLHDLHLVGSYERAITDNDPSILYYVPTFGQAEILLRNVEYKMEGRMRMLEDSLFIVLVNSEISYYDAVMIYKNNATQNNPIPLNEAVTDDFIERMKSDLDEWLRDYYNEHLIFFNKIGPAASEKYREYEKQKTAILNSYVEDSIMELKSKLHKVNSTSVKLPNFSIFSITGMEIKLRDGVLRGLDSMYRRSMATGKKDKDVRMVDAIVGFSSLKVVYKYNAQLSNGMPPLNGLMIMTADELTSHMAMQLVKEPETVDLRFDFIRQMKPESLTIEGPANRMIANFKHILEHHIISLMTNALIHNIRSLSTLTRCHPILFGHVDEGQEQETEEEEEKPRPETEMDDNQKEGNVYLDEVEASKEAAEKTDDNTVGDTNTEEESPAEAAAPGAVSPRAMIVVPPNCPGNQQMGSDGVCRDVW
ncbi:uncharacterized protein LOC135075262 [Ostrinia nubilalis]|uniref:uncharacterized protein LOC135075262 n=1 Tax=Ostrinia nubilalis TaxID=29057 RepID=UPI0030822A54